MRPDRRRVRLLVSVTSESEARLAALCGADIVDCKNPALGALGALPADEVMTIRAAVPRQTPVSATVGDLKGEPEVVAHAVAAMALSGVEFVKVGLFPDMDARAHVRCLGDLDLRSCRLVGVLFADLDPDLSLIREMGAAGFAGVMLDTAEKDGRSLCDCLGPGELAPFVGHARAAGLFAGFAGALRLRHIPALVACEPDVLGFRGGLCRGCEREAEIDAVAVLSAKRAIRSAACRHAGRALAEEGAR